MKDHYVVLGITDAASADEIRLAYRRKALEFHPDRNPSADAAERFRHVQEAYETLVDGDRRQAYDENRRRNLLDHPLQTAREIWQSYLEGVLR